MTVVIALVLSKCQWLTNLYLLLSPLLQHGQGAAASEILPTLVPLRVPSQELANNMKESGVQGREQTF